MQFDALVDVWKLAFLVLLETTPLMLMLHHAFFKAIETKLIAVQLGREWKDGLRTFEISGESHP
jgi:hypothetical protein